MSLPLDLEKLIISYTDPEIYKFMMILNPKNYFLSGFYQMIKEYSWIITGKIILNYQNQMDKLNLKIQKLRSMTASYEQQMYIESLKKEHQRIINNISYRIIKKLQDWELIKIYNLKNIQLDQHLNFKVQIIEDIQNYAELLYTNEIVEYQKIIGQIGYIFVHNATLKFKLQYDYINPSITISNTNQLWRLLKIILFEKIKF
jgi:hypothetical protein